MKKERLLSGLIGFGCACTISGIVMITIGTNFVPPPTKEISPQPLQTVEVVKEVVKEVPVELSDEDIKIKATELGMIDINSESERIIKLRKLNLTESSSMEIARRLETEGIIKDHLLFHQYIQEQGKTRILQTGIKEFKLQSTYEEALNVLLNKK